jgi:hypothetical protein
MIFISPLACCMQALSMPSWGRGVGAKCHASQRHFQSEVKGEETEARKPTCSGTCANTWQQCGGATFEFAKHFRRCCKPSDHCVFRNVFYSQCRPVARRLPTWWSNPRVIDCSVTPALLAASNWGCQQAAVLCWLQNINFSAVHIHDRLALAAV